MSRFCRTGNVCSSSSRVAGGEEAILSGVAKERPQSQGARMQPPIFGVVDGGADVSREADEWAEAWRLIADACERGLTGLHPQHPRRGDLLALHLDALAAAGLPDAPRLRSV